MFRPRRQRRHQRCRHHRRNHPNYCSCARNSPRPVANCNRRRNNSRRRASSWTRPSNRWRKRRPTTPSCATPTMRSSPSSRTPTSDWPPPRLPGARTTKSSVNCERRTRCCGSLPSAKPPRHLSAGKAKKAPMVRRFPSFAAGVPVSTPRRWPRNNPNRKQPRRRRPPPHWKNLAEANW